MQRRHRDCRIRGGVRVRPDVVRQAARASSPPGCRRPATGRRRKRNDRGKTSLGKARARTNRRRARRRGKVCLAGVHQSRGGARRPGRAGCDGDNRGAKGGEGQWRAVAHRFERRAPEGWRTAGVRWRIEVRMRRSETGGMNRADGWPGRKSWHGLTGLLGRITVRSCPASPHRSVPRNQNLRANAGVCRPA